VVGIDSHSDAGRQLPELYDSGSSKSRRAKGKAIAAGLPEGDGAAPVEVEQLVELDEVCGDGDEGGVDDTAGDQVEDGQQQDRFVRGSVSVGFVPGGAGDRHPDHRRLRRYSPVTPLGQLIASIVMILGYSITAVPTGIVTVEMGKLSARGFRPQACPFCGAEGHDGCGALQVLRGKVVVARQFQQHQSAQKFQNPRSTIPFSGTKPTPFPSSNLKGTETSSMPALRWRTKCRCGPPE